MGHNTRAGYYSQYRVDMLQPGRTVLEEALDTPERMTEESIRTLLGAFLFRGDDVFKKITRPERRGKKPARAGQAPAPSAQSAAHGRTDHAPGHGQH